MITILHTGQTGVERGADRAARAAGFEVRGFCQRDRRDEWGPLPLAIAADLQPAENRGVRMVWPLTLALAEVLVIAVPDRRSLKSNPGIAALQTMARARGVPQIVVDPLSDLDALAADLRRRELVAENLSIMVCGPRATRWHEGERLGWQLVMTLASLRQSRPCRVLVVDDHSDAVSMMCRLVSLLGHDCVTATTGYEAIESADAHHPEVALVDIRLPDITGYEVARRLRSMEKGPLFLAAVTGWAQATDEAIARNAGFDQCLLKPVGAEVIQSVFDRVRELLPI